MCVDNINERRVVHSTGTYQAWPEAVGDDDDD